MSAAHETTGSWRRLLDAGARQSLAARLLAFARQRRWFRAKSREIRGAEVADLIPLDGATLDDAANVLAVLHISYAEGEADVYVIPLASSGAPELARESPHAVIDGDDGQGNGLVDGLATGSAAAALFDLARTGGSRRGEHGEVRGEGSPFFAQLAGGGTLRPRVSRTEQTNSTVMFGDRAVLKVYRQLTAGPSPELEVGRFLTDACDPPCVPRVLGALSYQPHDGPAYSLGIAHEQIANQGDAWSLALREVNAFFARARGEAPPLPAAGGAAWLAAARSSPAQANVEAIGSFLPLAATLGRRTGQLHLALAGTEQSARAMAPDFAPEPLSRDEQQGLVARATKMLRDALAALDVATRPGAKAALTPQGRALAQRLLAPDSEEKISRFLNTFRDAPLQAMKTRTHGDLHLGQVLALARGRAPGDAVDDFMIIDFEGEPARPLAERRAKSSPLRDVMGMARSFAYVPEAALREAGAGSREGGSRALSHWGALWTREVTAEYLRAYLRTVDGASFIPRDDAQLSLLLTYYELERVIYEVGYELDNRPDWTEIPLRGLIAAAGLEGGQS